MFLLQKKPKQPTTIVMYSVKKLTYKILFGFQSFILKNVLIVHFYKSMIDFKRPNELYNVHLLSTSTLLTPNNQ